MDFRQNKKLVKQKTRRIPTKNGRKTINDLSDDELLLLFSFLDLRNQFIVRRVCIRWRILMRYVLNSKQSLSFVNDTELLNNWRYDRWFEVIPAFKQYTKVRFNCVNSSLNKILSLCPNLKDLDMECYDMNTQTIKTIATKCPNLERINFDSSNGFSWHLANHLAQDFQKLKIVNLSCVSKISETFVTKLLQSLTQLIALNLCGTDITGQCLSLLSPNMSHLNVSYCWNLERVGLMALTQSKCETLKELVVNNFNFDTQSANECLSTICAKFSQLRRLEMSLGPCTQQSFYLNSLHYFGLSSIARLKQLEVLIIRKICVLDDNSLRDILFGCFLLKELVIDMYSESTVTDLSISYVANCSRLEVLEMSHNKQISAQTLRQVIRRLSKLRSLSLRFTNADNDVVSTAVSYCPHLRSICLNGCPQISRNSLLAFIESAKTVVSQKFEFTAISSGIESASIYTKNNSRICDIPTNLEFKVSTGRTRQYLWFDSGRFYYSRNPKFL